MRPQSVTLIGLALQNGLEYRNAVNSGDDSSLRLLEIW